FDNVSGAFPIGFKIWNTQETELFEYVESDIFDEAGSYLGKKVFTCIEKEEAINKWISQFKSNSNKRIGFLCGTNGNDFQHNNIVYILNRKEQMANPRGIWITDENLIQCTIYNAIRHSINASWLNDRDVFSIPKEKYRQDNEFQNNCLIWNLFDNNIQSMQGTNHWIPFTEQEVQPKNGFASHFMTDYIKQHNIRFSGEAQAVLEAGKALWKYYHSQPDSDPNASYYDIREYFQGRNDKGKMNNKSGDETYNVLIYDLRQKMKVLQKKIIPKIYEYGFLLQ
ncbi:MAG: hypothetical protein J5706_01325, partial [Elusimicrobiales bacterium]|nr:hypothetical protein [Elusimicrobiales bacterium]